MNSITLFGYNSIASHLARIFSSGGLQIYLHPSEHASSYSSPYFTIVNDANDIPYLSSILINCQNDFHLVKKLINSFPNEYKQRMAYVECSATCRLNQLELFFEEMKFSFYLFMNLIELDTSTLIQPHFHLICSGDEVVYEKLLRQRHLPVKITLLYQTKSPFDAFYLCLLHRYSQAIHLLIYAEIMAILKAANEVYPGSLQYLFDWSYIKRPLMRQIVLESSRSSFTCTSINDFQDLLECLIDYFPRQMLNHHLQQITHKLHGLISNLDPNQKQMPLFQLFTLF
ncbi:unnamed protein product [Adineta ricciae]|uniref:Uncharacterized protein n=1 Tax=Adineta ricciae TaxID=249248 RepID=A0A815JRQ1_ADIRI|nr:unnamed protein product [Adineta ricciae]